MENARLSPAEKIDCLEVGRGAESMFELVPEVVEVVGVE